MWSVTISTCLLSLFSLLRFNLHCHLRTCCSPSPNLWSIKCRDLPRRQHKIEQGQRKWTSSPYIQQNNSPIDKMLSERGVEPGTSWSVDNDVISESNNRILRVHCFLFLSAYVHRQCSIVKLVILDHIYEHEYNWSPAPDLGQWSRGASSEDSIGQDVERII